MTKYLIIGLIILIFITGLILIIASMSSQNDTEPGNTGKIARSPAPSSIGTIPDPSTFVPTPIPSEDFAEYQTQTDKLYADQIKRQDEEYPWLQQLPLQTNDYFVYFETSNNTFTAEIYSPSREEQLKQEITQRLSALNIDLSKYSIRWEVKLR